MPVPLLKRVLVGPESPSYFAAVVPHNGSVSLRFSPGILVTNRHDFKSSYLEFMIRKYGRARDLPTGR
jgi:hypothetical protein